MKWYFALNADSIAHDRLYARCVEVAVLSALQHTDLQPHMLFDGPACDLTRWVQRMGGVVVPHRSSLGDAIAASSMSAGMKQIARGAYMRLDLPLIDFESEYVLYTDCDVMFAGPLEFGTLRPALFAVAPEFTIGDFSQMNSGVMLMHLPGLRREARAFDEFVRAGLDQFPAFDQGALRAFFAGRWDELPERFNWKPYWGLNDDAAVVHFHGPKPPQVVQIVDHPEQEIPNVLRELHGRAPTAYAHYLGEWQAYSARAQAL